VIRLVGLDLSLTSTGVARLHLDDDGTVVGSHTVVVGYPLDSDASLEQHSARIVAVARGVLDEVVPPLGRPAPHLVAVEQAPMRSNDPGTAIRHALRWRVYAHLFRHDVHVVEVNPATLKLYATGDGRADKTAVVQAIRRHYGDRFDIPLRKADGREDVADAIALVAMAARAVGHPIDLDHPTRLRAVRTPQWHNREDR